MAALSLETLTTEVDNLKLEIATLKTNSENHVTYTQFYWVVGILMTIVGGMFLLIWQQLQQINDSETATKQSVSFIQGQIQNASVTK